MLFWFFPFHFACIYNKSFPDLESSNEIQIQEHRLSGVWIRNSISRVPSTGGQTLKPRADKTPHANGFFHTEGNVDNRNEKNCLIASPITIFALAKVKFARLMGSVVIFGSYQILNLFTGSKWDYKSDRAIKVRRQASEKGRETSVRRLMWCDDLDGIFAALSPLSPKKAIKEMNTLNPTPLIDFLTKFFLFQLKLNMKRQQAARNISKSSWQ